MDTKPEITDKKLFVATLFYACDKIIHREARAGKSSEESNAFLVTWQVNIDEHTITDLYYNEIIIRFREGK